MTLPIITGGHLFEYVRRQGCRVVSIEGSVAFVCAPGRDRDDPLVPVVAIHTAQRMLSWGYIAYTLNKLGLAEQDFRDEFERLDTPN